MKSTYYRRNLKHVKEFIEEMYEVLSFLAQGS
jgi:hypothetical protein